MATQPATERYKSFREFYPFYIHEHSNQTCRRIHVVGSALVLAILAAAIATRNPWWLIGMPLVGYGFAWVSHMTVEKNRPATFTYPVYSFMGDWMMFWEMVTGKIVF